MKPIIIAVIVISASAAGFYLVAKNNNLPKTKEPAPIVSNNIVQNTSTLPSASANKTPEATQAITPATTEDQALKAIKILYPEAKTLATGDPRFTISEIKENEKFQYPEAVKYVIFGSENKSYYFTYSQPNNPPLQMQAILLGFKPLYGETSKLIQSEAYINKSTKVVCLRGNIKSIINPSGIGGYFDAIVACSTYDSLEAPVISDKLDSFMSGIYAFAKQKGAGDSRFKIGDIYSNIGENNSYNIGRFCFSFDQSNATRIFDNLSGTTKIFDQSGPFSGFVVDNHISADGPQGSISCYTNNTKKIDCSINTWGMQSDNYKPSDPWDHEYLNITVCCRDI